MRVCLGIKAWFDHESVVTVAASEPVLTEAAATVMQYNFRSCRALRGILQWPGMSKGEQGELVTCDISIDTLDSLMFEDKALRSLVVDATSYFEALFASDIYEKKIEDSFPSKLRELGQNKTFAETFKDSRIYVTHFIKVYDYKVLSAEFLMKCAAAIVCADNQLDVDVILPMIYKDQLLKKENVTCILVQSKNDAMFSIKPQRYLFDAMRLSIFTTNPPPVIRMVYALASCESAVCIVRRPSRKVNEEKPMTTLPLISGVPRFPPRPLRPFNQTRTKHTIGELLKLSRDIPNVFEPKEDDLKADAKSMYPCATSDPGHWQSCCGTATI